MLRQQQLLTVAPIPPPPERARESPEAYWARLGRQSEAKYRKENPYWDAPWRDRPWGPYCTWDDPPGLKGRPRLTCGNGCCELRYADGRLVKKPYWWWAGRQGLSPWRRYCPWTGEDLRALQKTIAEAQEVPE